MFIMDMCNFFNMLRQNKNSNNKESFPKKYILTLLVAVLFIGGGNTLWAQNAADFVWDGGTGSYSDYETTENWTNDIIPSTNSTVSIPTVINNNYPVIFNDVNNVTITNISDGASLTLRPKFINPNDSTPSNRSLNITFSDVTNSGKLNINKYKYYEKDTSSGTHVETNLMSYSNLTVTNLTNNRSGVITIDEGCTLTITGKDSTSFTNEGRIINNGTIKTDAPLNGKSVEGNQPIPITIDTSKILVIKEASFDLSTITIDKQYDKIIITGTENQTIRGTTSYHFPILEINKTAGSVEFTEQKLTTTTFIDNTLGNPVDMHFNQGCEISHSTVFKTSGTVTFGADSIFNSALTHDNGQTVIQGPLKASSINLGISQITSTITTQGNQTYNGNLTLLGNVTIDASKNGIISLDTITGTQNLTISNAKEVNFTKDISNINNLEITASSTILPTNITTIGNQTYNSSISLNSTSGTTFDASTNGIISFNIITGTQNLSISNAKEVNFTKDISNIKNLEITASSIILPAKVTTRGAQNYNGKITSQTGSLTLNTDGTNGVLINNGASLKNITFSTNTPVTIKGLFEITESNLTLPTTSFLFGTIQTSGTQTYTGDVTLIGDTKLYTSESISFNSTITSQTPNNYTLIIGDSSITNPTPKTVSITGDITVLNSLDISASEKISLPANVSTAGNQTYNGPINLNKESSLTAPTKSIIFNDTANINSKVTLNCDSVITSSPSPKSFTIENNGTLIIEGNFINNADSNITNKGMVSITQNYTNEGSYTGNGKVTLNGNSHQIFSNTQNDSYDIVINNSTTDTLKSSITFSNAINLANLETNNSIDFKNTPIITGDLKISQDHNAKISTPTPSSLEVNNFINNGNFEFNGILKIKGNFTDNGTIKNITNLSIYLIGTATDTQTFTPNASTVYNSISIADNSHKDILFNDNFNAKSLSDTGYTGNITFAGNGSLVNALTINTTGTVSVGTNNTNPSNFIFADFTHTAGITNLNGIITANKLSLGSAFLASSITTTSSQSYTGAVNLIGDTTLSATDNASSNFDINFTSTVDSNASLTINKAKNVTFSEAIGSSTPIKALTIDGVENININQGGNVNGDITLAPAVNATINTNIIKANNFIHSKGKIIINSPLEATNAINLLDAQLKNNLTANEVQLANTTVSGTRIIKADSIILKDNTPTSFAINIPTNSDSLTLDGNFFNNGQVIGNGKLILTKDLTNTTLKDSISSPIELNSSNAQKITINSDNFHDITIKGSSGLVTFVDSIKLNELITSRPISFKDNVTIKNDLTINLSEVVTIFLDENKVLTVPNFTNNGTFNFNGILETTNFTNIKNSQIDFTNISSLKIKGNFIDKGTIKNITNLSIYLIGTTPDTQTFTPNASTVYNSISIADNNHKDILFNDNFKAKSLSDTGYTGNINFAGNGSLVNDLILNTTGIVSVGTNNTTLSTFTFANFTHNLGTTILNGNIKAKTLSLGSASLASSITTTSSQSYSGAVKLIGDTTLSATDNISPSPSMFDINFSSTVDGDAPLTINKAKDVTFSEAIGSITPIKALTIDGVEKINLPANVITRSNQTYNAPTFITQNTILSTDLDIYFKDSIIGQQYSFTISKSQNVTLNSNISELSILSISSNENINLPIIIKTTSNQFYKGKLSINSKTSKLESTSGNIEIIGSIEGNADFMITVSNSDKTLQSITLPSIVNTNTANQTYTGTVHLASPSTSLQSTGNITFNNNIDSSNSLIIGESDKSIPNRVTIVGNIGSDASKLSSVNIIANTISLPENVYTSGNQTYTGSLNLHNPRTTFTSGDILNFNTDIDSTSFNANAKIINLPSIIKTSSSQKYTGTIKLANETTFTASDLTFNQNKIDAGNNNITLNATTNIKGVVEITSPLITNETNHTINILEENDSLIINGSILNNEQAQINTCTTINNSQDAIMLYGNFTDKGIFTDYGAIKLIGNKEQIFTPNSTNKYNKIIINKDKDSKNLVTFNTGLNVNNFSISDDQTLINTPIIFKGSGSISSRIMCNTLGTISFEREKDDDKYILKESFNHTAGNTIILNNLETSTLWLSTTTLEGSIDSNDVINLGTSGITPETNLYKVQINGSITSSGNQYYRGNVILTGNSNISIKDISDNKNKEIKFQSNVTDNSSHTLNVSVPKESNIIFTSNTKNEKTILNINKLTDIGNEGNISFDMGGSIFTDTTFTTPGTVTVNNVDPIFDTLFTTNDKSLKHLNGKTVIYDKLESGTTTFGETELLGSISSSILTLGDDDVTPNTTNRVISLSGSITTTGSQTYKGPITLTDTTSLLIPKGGDGLITFYNTIKGDQKNLSIENNSLIQNNIVSFIKNKDIGEDQKPLNSLSINSASISLPQNVYVITQIYNGSLSSTADNVLLRGHNIELKDSIDNDNLNLQIDIITKDSKKGTLTFNDSNGNVDTTNSAKLASFKQTGDGIVLLSGDITTKGIISFTSPITLKGKVSLIANNSTIDFSGNIEGNYDILLGNDTTTSITLPTSINTSTGNQIYCNTQLILPTSTGTTLTGAAITIYDDINGNGNSLTITNSDTLNILDSDTTAADNTISNVNSLNNFIQNGGSLVNLAGDITASNNISFTSNISLLGDVSLIGTTITTSNTIDGNFNLKLGSDTTTDINLQGNIGKDSPLTTITTNATHNISLPSIIKTTSDETYNGPVTFIDTTIITTQDTLVPITFTKTLKGSDITFNIPNGEVSVAEDLETTNLTINIVKGNLILNGVTTITNFKDTAFNTYDLYINNEGSILSDTEFITSGIVSIKTSIQDDFTKSFTFGNTDAKKNFIHINGPTILQGTINTNDFTTKDTTITGNLNCNNLKTTKTTIDGSINGNTLTMGQTVFSGNIKSTDSIIFGENNETISLKGTIESVSKQTYNGPVTLTNETTMKIPHRENTGTTFEDYVHFTDSSSLNLTNHNLTLEAYTLYNGLNITKGNITAQHHDFIVQQENKSSTISSTILANYVIIDLSKIGSTNTLTFNGNITTAKDLAIYGSSFCTTDQESGNENIYVYDLYHNYVSPINPTLPTSKEQGKTISYAPEKLTIGSDINFTVGKSLYINGATIDGNGKLTFTLPTNKNVSPTLNYATAYYTDFSNTNIVISDTDKAKIVTEACKLNASQESSNVFDYEPFIIDNPNTYIIDDNVIQVKFDRPIRIILDDKDSLNNGLNKAQGDRILYSSGSYESIIFTKNKSGDFIPLTDADDSIETIYLTASDTWNTDATGSDEGLGTDKEGNHKSVVPFLDIKRNDSTYNYFITDLYGKRLTHYSTNKANINTIYRDAHDKCDPVLVSVSTGQELHTTDSSILKSYDAHNFLELRYSEKVRFGETDNAFTDFDNKDFTFTETQNITAQDATFGLVEDKENDFSISRLGKVEKGRISTGPSNVNALYRKDPFSIRISIAGLTTGSGKDMKWNGYINAETKQPSGTFTVDMNNSPIYDMDKNPLTTSNLQSKGETLNYNNNTQPTSRIISVPSKIPTGCSEANFFTYGEWDLSAPTFAPVNIITDEAHWNSENPYEYEILGYASGGTKIENLEFHMFDNTHNYNSSNPKYVWYSTKGWLEENQQITACADIFGGARPYLVQPNGLPIEGKATTGGIRFHTLNAEAFSYKTNTSKSGNFKNVFDHNNVHSSFFTGFSIGEKLEQSAPGELYFSLELDNKEYPIVTNFTISYNPNEATGYVTDLAGNKLLPTKENQIHTIDRTPPAFNILLSPINQDEIFIVFSKELQTNLDELIFRVDTKHEIPQMYNSTYEEALPYSFKIIKIDDNGNVINNAEGIPAIDTSTPASIQTIKKADGATLTSIRLKLTRPLTYEDLITCHIQLAPTLNSSGQPISTSFDPITGTKDARVTIIRDRIGNFMPMYTANLISDFGINIINPLYAHNSAILNGEDSFMDGLYEDGSWAVHDWNRNQQNYGTLYANKDVQIVASLDDGTKEQNNLPKGAAIFLDSSPDSESVSARINKDLASLKVDYRIWLPSLKPTDYLFNSMAPVNNTEYHTISSDKESENGKQNDSTLLFNINEDVAKSLGNNKQVSFLFAISENEITPETPFSPLLLYNSPTIEGPDKYDLSQSTQKPLYCLRLEDPNDITSIDLWSYKTKTINRQRGGVTILNNVINATNGEDAVINITAPSSGNLSVMILTLDGNVVQYLHRGNIEAGEYNFYWNGTNLNNTKVARGLYFVRVIGLDIDETRKIMVVR